MTNGIATQAELAKFQASLTRMGANMAFHINETPQPPDLPHPLGSTLSQAHGIALIEGYVDDDGNDLRDYRDSGGDLVSDAYTSGKKNFVRLIVGATPYYAPVQSTSLAGKSISTGQLGSADATSDAPASASLITDYVTTESQTAGNIDSLLREHTTRTAENAHVPLTVITKDIYDDGGHLVSTHAVRMQIDGVVYEILCSNRLGGPDQTPVISSQPINASLEGSTEPLGPANFSCTTSAGTKPLTFQWQYSNSTEADLSHADYYDNSKYIDMGPPGGAGTFAGLSGTGTSYRYPSTSFSYTIVKFTTYSTLAVTQTGTDDDNQWLDPAFVFRLKITSAGGSVTYSVPFKLSTRDNTGSWLCTVAYDRGHIPKSVYRADMVYTQRHVGWAAKEGYGLWAFPLSRQMYKHDWLLHLWLPAIKAWTYHMAYLHGTVKKDNLAGLIIFNTVRPLCALLGYAHHAWQWATGVSLIRIPSSLSR